VWQVIQAEFAFLPFLPSIPFKPLIPLTPVGPASQSLTHDVKAKKIATIMIALERKFL